MNRPQGRIARVRSLPKPPGQFNSGAKIYEPKTGDALAPMKRQIAAFALTMTDSFQDGRLIALVESTSFQNQTSDYRAHLESSIEDGEIADCLEQLATVHELIAEGSTAVRRPGS